VTTDRAARIADLARYTDSYSHRRLAGRVMRARPACSLLKALNKNTQCPEKSAARLAAADALLDQLPLRSHDNMSNVTHKTAAP